MLAGPPPTSFNTSPTLPTVQPQSQPMYHNQYQPPILPPNFQGNHQPKQPSFPVQPPNYANNQYHHPPSQPSMIPNGMSQPPMQHFASDQVPPLTSTHIASTVNPPSNHFAAPPPTMPGQYPSSQPPFGQQPPPSATSNMSTMPAYHHGSHPLNQPLYNGPPAAYSTGSNGPPSSYPSQPQYPNPAAFSGSATMPGPSMNGPGSYPSQPQYSNQPSLTGPSAMPGPDAYPGQPPSTGPNQQPFPSTRISPDTLPSVVQVLEQNQEKVHEPFLTNAPGVLPPLAATNFVCQDQGNCNPRFVRSTTYALPNSADMVKQSQIPIALSISPLASLRPDELEPPLTTFGEIGPVRCHRCKAYMCSFMQFIDGGKRFICCFCEAATDVPNEYFNHLDHSGRRMDCYQRPELCLGSYEISATKQYCKDEKWPEPPAFIFMIDVSYNSVRSGLVHHLCQILKNDLLDYLPKDKNNEISTVRVGFATFDKQVHFYNIKNTLGQPQMMIVSDLEDMFVPLLEGFLCSPRDSRGVINSLLDQIPQTFASSQETEMILAPVIQSGLEALKGAGCGGKLYIFSTTLPIAVAPGKLSNRDDKKLLSTDKEKTLLSPVNNVYTKLGEECAQNGCGVDLFVFPNNYVDLATIGEVCRVSGGEMYKFNYFSIETDGDRLFDDLKRNFQRSTVFDALMRVRTSAGIRPVDFLGNFYMTNTTEMIFGSLDSDKSISVELKHDDKLPADSNIYTQVALLYTSISGQRRLRILTLALTTTSSYTALYPGCDLDTIINYITKIAVRSISISTPKSIRDNIITQAASMLACYHKNCAQASTAGQLILPETMKLLPIYTAALIKSDAVIGSQTVTTDDRSWLMHRLMSMNVKGTSVYLYPRIHALHTLQDGQIPPSRIRCLSERLLDHGAYVIENGLVMYIWLGIQVDPTFVQSLFGPQSISHVPLDKCRIVELDNSVSKNVCTLLETIRNERNSYMKLFIMQQRDSMEPFFKNYLVEDKGFTGGASYVDFLYHLHREIRNILQ